MHVIVIYALSYASAIGLLMAWRLSQFITIHAREHIFSFYSKWLLYTVVYPRFNGSTDVTMMAGSIIVLFVVANVVGSVLGVQSRSDLTARLARMCVTNLVVLYIGGRSNFLVDKIFRLSNSEYYLLHRWIGRITIVEGLTHGTLCVIKTKAVTRVVDLAVRILTFFVNHALIKTSFISPWPPLRSSPLYTYAVGYMNSFFARTSSVLSVSWRYFGSMPGR
jgi:hypothetical protein